MYCEYSKQISAIFNFFEIYDVFDNKRNDLSIDWISINERVYWSTNVHWQMNDVDWLMFVIDQSTNTKYVISMTTTTIFIVFVVVKSIHLYIYNFRFSMSFDRKNYDFVLIRHKNLFIDSRRNFENVTTNERSISRKKSVLKKSVCIVFLI